jgi:hypothetical protein
VEAVKTEKHNGRTIKIIQDQEPMSPREWDNLGTMVCWHRRSNLGDKQSRDAPTTIEDASEIEKHGGVVLPLYLYEHSGMTMDTIGFSCPWDSGQVGIIYAEKATILKEYNVTDVTPEIRERVLKVLRSEVETYDQWLQGDVYGFVIEDAEGEHLDSCWGFFGVEDCLEAAKESSNAMPTQFELAL